MVPFLYSCPDTLSNELCEKLIDAFEKSELKNEVEFFLQDGSIHKKATEIYFTDSLNASWITKERHLWYDSLFELNDILVGSCYNYFEEYPELYQTPSIECISFNMQKYNPGEGFPNWHFESSYGSGDRVLAWMAYLNDVDDGGTEFKYQKHLEKAEKGKFLIWPADWSFTHRGQVSETKTKYILTGWFTKIDLSKLDFPEHLC